MKIKKVRNKSAKLQIMKYQIEELQKQRRHTYTSENNVQYLIQQQRDQNNHTAKILTKNFLVITEYQDQDSLKRLSSDQKNIMDENLSLIVREQKELLNNLNKATANIGVFEQLQQIYHQGMLDNKQQFSGLIQSWLSDINIQQQSLENDQDNNQSITTFESMEKSQTNLFFSTLGLLRFIKWICILGSKTEKLTKPICRTFDYREFLPSLEDAINCVTSFLERIELKTSKNDFQQLVNNHLSQSQSHDTDQFFLEIWSILETIFQHKNKFEKVISNNFGDIIGKIQLCSVKFSLLRTQWGTRLRESELKYDSPSRKFKQALIKKQKAAQVKKQISVEIQRFMIRLLDLGDSLYDDKKVAAAYKIILYQMFWVGFYSNIIKDWQDFTYNFSAYKYFQQYKEVCHNIDDVAVLSDQIDVKFPTFPGTWDSKDVVIIMCTESTRKRCLKKNLKGYLRHVNLLPIYSTKMVEKLQLIRSSAFTQTEDKKKFESIKQDQQDSGSKFDLALFNADMFDARDMSMQDKISDISLALELQLMEENIPKSIEDDTYSSMDFVKTIMSQLNQYMDASEM